MPSRRGEGLRRAPAEWTLREIRVNGIDVTDRPLAFGKAVQQRPYRDLTADDQLAHEVRHQQRRQGHAGHHPPEYFTP